MEPTPLTDLLSIGIACLALLVAILAAYFTWRAYALQRVASTPAGLHFMVRSIQRRVPIEQTKPDQSAHRMQQNLLLGVHARGPGVRYNAAVVVWGEVEARFLGEARTSWSAEDGLMTAEVFAPPPSLRAPVYFGVVWESPAIGKRGFVAHGYRMRLKWTGKGVDQDYMEVWSDRAHAWLLMPTPDPKKNMRSPVEQHQAMSRDLYEQMFFEAHKRVWV